MNKKKLFITLALLAVVVSAIVLLGACEMISENPDPDAMGISGMEGGERLVTGLLVAAMGLIVVFVVLIVLIFLIKLFKLLVDSANKAAERRAEENKGKEKKTLSQKLQERKAAKAEEKQALLEAARVRLGMSEAKEQPEAIESDEEEIAAVMAAIYAYYDSLPAYERSNLKFRVRSIKQIK